MQPDVKSLIQLHNILYGVTQQTKKNVTLSESHVQLLRFFDTFYDDVDYLRKSKRYFDEKIYMCLYDYFYDPTEHPEQDIIGLNDSRQRVSGKKKVLLYT